MLWLHIQLQFCQLSPQALLLSIRESRYNPCPSCRGSLPCSYRPALFKYKSFQHVIFIKSNHLFTQSLLIKSKFNRLTKKNKDAYKFWCIFFPQRIAYSFFEVVITDKIIIQILINLMHKPPSVDDYNFKCVIGKGTYAKVFLVTRKTDDQPFALKVLKKKYIIEKNQQNHIMTEKQILAQFSHPFLVKMISCFQDDKKLYFVLEYCPGGELFELLSAQDKLNEDQARFFSAQILLALDELHKHKIVYRDLKPENLIIDQTGYIKLADFGLSKILQSNDQKAQTICGTPQYLAPEIIRKEGHGIEVDWWCFGCLIHEMLTGFPPFQGENRMKLFQDIIYSQPNLKQFNAQLQDLFKRLFIKDPKKRLGHGGGKQIMNHPWFTKINFKLLVQKKIKAPFVPKLGSKIDTSSFSTEFTKSKIDSVEQSPIDSKIDDKFKGFEH